MQVSWRRWTGLGLCLACFAVRVSAAESRLVVYPPPDAQNMPTCFVNTEFPNPLPGVKTQLVGHPVTATFWGAKRVTKADMRIQEGKQALAAWFSSPEEPANPDYSKVQANTLCLIPKEPLKPGTTYNVRVHATVDGEAKSLKWSFTTENRLDEVEKLRTDFLAEVNRRRRQLGFDPLRLDPRISEACEEHQHYLTYNPKQFKALVGNQLRPTDRFFTYRASRISYATANSRINVSAREHAEDFMDFTTNRQYLLDPRLRVVGVGADIPFSCSGMSTIGVFGVPSPRVKVSLPWVYPPPYATDIPVRPRHGELLSAFGLRKVQCGFVLSITWPPGVGVDERRNELRDDKNERVLAITHAYFIPYADGSQAWTEFVVPLQPLKPATRYSWHIMGRMKSESFETIRTFTTQPDEGNRKERIAKETLAEINRIRMLCGLKKVIQDKEISQGCAEHAKYLMVHMPDLSGQNEAEGEKVHRQDPTLTHASNKGAIAASNSVIVGSTQNGTTAIQSFMQSLFHRIPLLNPDLEKVGIGVELYPLDSDRWCVVCDVRQGVRGGKSSK